MRCVECGIEATSDARGWIGLRIDIPQEGDEPETAFYCPRCAEREFGEHFAGGFAHPS